MQDRYFSWVDTMIGNIKDSLRGTYHALSKKHLPRYLLGYLYTPLHHMTLLYLY
ncbi:transposase [Vibrio vulnificus]|uniref:transposase n=1 Tax=Vibrio vulnificus TaxID=672 RepID=UPI003C130401